MSGSGEPLVGPVRVLEFDAGLGDALDERSFGEALQRCRAPLLVAGAGPLWVSELDPADAQDCLGFLILSGLVKEQTVVADERRGTELLFAGDVVRPWPSRDEGGVAVRRSWRVSRAVALALLDRGFVEKAARWPEILGALAEREARRARSLAVRLTIAQLSLKTRIHLSRPGFDGDRFSWFPRPSMGS